MMINANEIHIWSTDLTLSTEQENEKFILLSDDERARALRFHFPIHKQRFIAARSMLRTLLGIYLNVAPQNIVFAYDDHEKPSLKVPDHSSLQFNLSHSHEMAVFAFTDQHAVGVDIEQIQDEYHQGVAERYFSQQENQHLLSLPRAEQVRGFYRVWSRKEAIIKAIGKGLSMPLSQFSVSLEDRCEWIELKQDGTWMLIPLLIHPRYQAAVATHPSIQTVSYWTLFDHSPQRIKQVEVIL